jgi:hypothetical protein
MTHTDQDFNDMIKYFGAENIPNPNQYPRSFEFLVRCFEHQKKVKLREQSTDMIVRETGNMK